MCGETSWEAPDVVRARHDGRLDKVMTEESDRNEEI